MKTNHTIKTLLAALLLAAGPTGTHAASLLADGDFDNLPVGTAPDLGKPAGRWFWPTDYLVDPYEGVSWAETAASQLNMAPAQAAASVTRCGFCSAPQICQTLGCICPTN